MAEPHPIMERLTEKMKERGLNRRKLALALGLDYSRISKWFDGKGNPKRPEERVLEEWINDASWKNVPHGTVEKGEETSTPKSDDAQSYKKFLENRVAQLENEQLNRIAFLERVVENTLSGMRVSLDEILGNQGIGIDALDEILYRDIQREAKGNPGKVAEIRDEILKRRGIVLGSASQKGRTESAGTGGN